MQDVTSTTAQRYDGTVAEFKKYLKVRDIHGLEEHFDHGLHETGHLCVHYLRTCFAPGTLGPGQAGTLISGLRRHALLARSCGADLGHHQPVFRTLWRAHRSWSLAIPTEFRAAVSHEIVLSVAVSACLQNVQELSLLALLSFHCLLRPAEARQLRWCDVQIFDGSLSTRHEKVYGIVHTKEPKTSRMTGHAAQQHVLLDCPGVCQLINTMKFQILMAYSIQQSGHSLLLITSPISSGSSAALACHINITRSTGPEAVAFRSLASVSRLTTVTTQRSVDL